MKTTAKPVEVTLIREPPKAESGAGRKRLIAIAISAGVALAGLSTASYLGKLGYDIRRTAMHQARLEGVLRQEPTIYQVTEGLKEKAPLVSVARTRAEVASATEQWGKAKQSQIYDKAAQYAETRVFAAGDMIYFIFFDARSIMRDFELVSRER